MAELTAHVSVSRARDGAGRAGKSSRSGQRKGEAQQATAAGLDLLRVLGWLVLHDAHLPDQPEASVDHVLAGPSGVYVVNTVGWSGAIVVRDDVLTVGGTNRSEFLAEVAAAADAVRDLLGGTPVAPLLCFERLEAVVGVAADVALCASENILDLLTSQPQILDPAAVAKASRGLSNAFRPVVRPPVVRAVESAEAPAAPVVTGPTLDELVKARSAASAQPASVEPELVEPELVEPELVEPEVVEPELIEPEVVESRGPVEPPSAEDIARVEAFERLMGGTPAVPAAPKRHRFGLPRGRRGSKRVEDTAPESVDSAADVPVEVVVEQSAEVAVEAVADEATQSAIRTSDEAVSDAGAALWLALTDTGDDTSPVVVENVEVAEPVETTELVEVAELVDVEVALAEAEARQREAEAHEAEERAAAEAREVEARERSEREAQELAVRDAREAEARERVARHERERFEREAAARSEREAVEARERAERDARERVEQEAEQARQRAADEARKRAAQEALERIEREALELAEREAHEAQQAREAAELAEREAKARAEQEERERIEREAREAAEREAKQRAKQEAREAAEREAKARAEQEERERIEREAREAAEREAK